MVIDAHYHPFLISSIFNNNDIERWKKLNSCYKATPYTLEQFIIRMKANGINKCFMLPFDFTSINGEAIPNAKMKDLADKSDGLIIPFASIDPLRNDALSELKYSFAELGLVGLKLNLSVFNLVPTDKRLFQIYELCNEYRRPIVFHSGISWLSRSMAYYTRPVYFEKIAMEFPQLRICLAHFGFPYTREAATLMAKYPNIYADTAMLYFDSAQEFFEHEFKLVLDIGWVDRALRHQIMFGSNMPRFEQGRMRLALTKLGLRKETMELIFSKNALEFLSGSEVKTW